MAHSKDLAVGGFAKGDQYDAARPRYPEEALEHFVDIFHLDEHSRVLDLGAGTGIFTRQILEHVRSVTAVDPSASMRRTFAERTPGVAILDGSDVTIPLDDASVDVVFAAQAFHWFDHARALREIHRVLINRGGLGLIWNERDTDVQWVRELNHAMLWDVREPYDARVDYAAIVASGPFAEVRHSTFRHGDLLTHEDVLQRVLTTSYITLMEEEPRREVSAAVSSLLRGREDPVLLPYVTNVFTAIAR